jgi:hypothetical protein
MGMIKPPDFKYRKKFLIYSCLVGAIMLLGLLLLVGIVGGVLVVL